MFGMGFMEILLVAVIAIIALGPEKLPKAMVEIAKFLKKFKSGVEDAKSTLDNELNINEMKEEAARFKAQIEDAKSTIDVKSNLDLGLDDILKDDLKDSSKKETKKDDEKGSFKKVNEKKKKKKVKEESKKEEIIEEETPKKEVSSSDKFKVDFKEEEESK